MFAVVFSDCKKEVSMIQKIYLQNTKVFFGDSIFAREMNLVNKDCTISAKFGKSILLDCNGIKKEVNQEDLGIDEDDEGIFFEV
jgi:hypothetical protein